MLEKILPFEENLFYLINGSHTAFLDSMMWTFSGKIIWAPLALFVIYTIINKTSWKIWLPILLFIILFFVLSDQFASSICKPYFSRFRPSHYPEIKDNVRTLHGYLGGKYGFISSHASNSFGFAALTAFLFRNRFYTITIFLWAFIVAYSRVYLGVHFISDVVAGGIAGFTIGVLCYLLFRFYIQKSREFNEPLYSKKQATPVFYVAAGYMILVALFSEQLVLLGLK